MDLFSDRATELTSLEDVIIPDELRNRLSTYIPAVDTALGGEDSKGFVRGSSMLFGGDPGVGKSTLLIQVLGVMSEHGIRCVYDSAEESAAQLKMATERIGITPNDEFLVGNIPEVSSLAGAVKGHNGQILVVDSIQGLKTHDCDARAGSPTQLGESCDALIKFAKDEKIPLIIICQLCKDGSFRGPRGLEHNVDVVGMLKTGKQPDKYRLFYLEKNRFGPSHDDRFFPWLGGRYDFSPEAMKGISARDAVDNIERAKVERAKARLVKLNLQKQKSGPAYDDKTKLIIAVEKFKEYETHDVEILKQILCQTRDEYGHFFVTMRDIDVFGVKEHRMENILSSLAIDRRFRAESKDPWVIVI